MLLRGPGSFGYPSHAGSFVVLLRSYGLAQWKRDGPITCWINRCTRQCYRCVQHLYVLPTIHHRSRSWHQCQAHACHMHLTTKRQETPTINPNDRQLTKLTYQSPSSTERSARESRRITYISTAAVHAFSTATTRYHNMKCRLHIAHRINPLRDAWMRRDPYDTRHGTTATLEADAGRHPSCGQRPSQTWHD